MTLGVKTTGIDQKKLRPLIDKVRQKIKDHPVVIKMFQDYDVNIDEIDLIPMCFAEMDVSAKTDHGCLYFNINLLDDNDFDKDDHYVTHEITHFLQQCTGTKPTPGSDSGDYLKNPAEVEAFNNQSEYISDTRSDKDAKDYINKVLDHHDVKGKKRKERMDALLELSEK